MKKKKSYLIDIFKKQKKQKDIMIDPNKIKDIPDYNERIKALKSLWLTKTERENLR